MAGRHSHTRALPLCETADCNARQMNRRFLTAQALPARFLTRAAECDAEGPGLRGMSFKSRLAAFVARVLAIALRARSASSKWPAATANSISCDGLGS
jgi:hypothetical protein